jgi:hypothetical protein
MIFSRQEDDEGRAGSEWLPAVESGDKRNLAVATGQT